MYFFPLFLLFLFGVLLHAFWVTNGACLLAVCVVFWGVCLRVCNNVPEFRPLFGLGRPEKEVLIHFSSSLGTASPRAFNILS
jgi:hypothetical protein